MERSGIDRRELFKRAGVGSAALASFPALAGAAWADDDDDDDDDQGRRFYFQALSGRGATIGGGETIIMSGCGSFSDRSVRGGGEFVHFDGTKLPAIPPIIASGSWSATRFVSFKEVGTFGVGVAGILELQIKLLPCDLPVVRGATLVVVCNIGPARLMTGQPEGYFLTVPGNATPFSPFHPEVGLTFFTRPCEDEEEEEDD